MPQTILYKCRLCWKSSLLLFCCCCYFVVVVVVVLLLFFLVVVLVLLLLLFCSCFVVVIFLLLLFCYCCFVVAVLLFIWKVKLRWGTWLFTWERQDIINVLKNADDQCSGAISGWDWVWVWSRMEISVIDRYLGPSPWLSEVSVAKKASGAIL